MPNNPRRGAVLLLEGFVVLVSILAAFLLEGWRNDRELARDLEQELASVQLELGRNRDQITAEVDVLRRLGTAGDALVGALSSSDASQVSVPDTIAFLALQWHPSFSPSLGAVNALISSGRLAQIVNPDLRLGLAGLSESVNDALEEEVFARQISVEQLLPLVGENVDYGPISRIAIEFFGLSGNQGLTPQERSIDRPVPTEGSMLLPNSSAIRTAALRRNTWLGAARSEFEQLREHLDDLITLIALEIGQPPAFLYVDGGPDSGVE